MNCFHMHRQRKTSCEQCKSIRAYAQLSNASNAFLDGMLEVITRESNVQMRARWHIVHMPGKEIDHAHLIDNLQPRMLPRRSFLHCTNEACVQKARIELHFLPGCDVTLEGISQTERCLEIMGVHDNMCDQVDQSAIRCRATANVCDQKIAPDHGDSGMVVYVKERELPPILP